MWAFEVGWEFVLAFKGSRSLSHLSSRVRLQSPDVAQSRLTGRYMIGLHVTVNRLIYKAVVAMLISWRLNRIAMDCQSLSQLILQ